MVKEGIIENPRALEGVSTSELLVIIGVLVFINLILICVYRSTLNSEIKKDMKVKVSSAVSQYIALSQMPELNENNETTV